MMIKLITTRRLYIVIGFFVLLFVLLIFGNLLIVKANPGGLDFFSHWYATRIYIKDGVNPYSDISISRLAEAIDFELNPADGEVYRFVAPLFSIVLYAPLSLVGDFTIARAIWMALLEISIVICGVLLMNWFPWKKNLIITTILSLVTLFALPSVMAVTKGSLVVAGMLLFCVAATLILKKHDEAAGSLLAFSLVQPPLFFIGVLVILIWSGFRKRSRIIWWFLGTFTLLVGFTMLLIPDWIISYTQILTNYTNVNPMQPSVEIDNLMTYRLMLKSVAILILLFYEWIIIKEAGKRRIAWNFALLLVTIPWMTRNIPIENTILYLPSLLIAVSLLGERWKEKALSIVLLLPISLFLLAWVFSGVLIPGISIVLSKIIIYVVQPLIILLFIYWSRWWVLSSEKFHNPLN